MVAKQLDDSSDILFTAAQLQKNVDEGVNAGSSEIRNSAQEMPTNETKLELLQIVKKLGRFKTVAPEISIVIPVYNKVDYTLACLDSLSKHKSKYSFEVIVVDNASSDSTPQVITKIPGIKYIHNENNEGFVGGCNSGVKIAQSKVIVLLNNDTLVQTNWLDTLIDRLYSDQSIGLVGSKLIYPDGRLQEAGSILFNDASGHNYGKNMKADSFEYNYCREVDYCSAASVAFFKHDFDSLGGFDELFSPAYYEDADLAMSLRYKLGKRIIYEPMSVIVHVEGGTAGTDIGGGFKRFQKINHEKFLKKWHTELDKYHYPPGKEPILAARYGHKRRLLIVDGIVPEYNHDSGSLRMTELAKAAMNLDYDVTFFPDNRVATMPYTAQLQSLGVEVVYGDIDHRDFYQSRFDMYNEVLLSRPLCAIWHLSYCKVYLPSAKIIYDTVDLHYLRISRLAELEKSQKLHAESKLWQALEYYLMDNTDSTLIVSYDEQKLLNKSKPEIKTFVVSNINPAPEVGGGKQPSFNERKGLLFIGSYNHLPNRDAALWFTKKIFPTIEKKLPNINLELLGTDPTDEIIGLAASSIHVPGFIDDVMPNFNSARMFICPLRYGAGVKGKVSHALACGLPIVSTTIGVEGMHLKDGFNCLTADTADEFADKVVQLYNDQKLWEKLRKNALQTYQENFSQQAGLKALKLALNN